MAAVARRRSHEGFVWTTIPYVNRAFRATAVTKISGVVNNPG
jgi:hypothetical protein